MLRKARYCLVSGLWILIVCTVAQGAVISVDNVVRSYTGSARTTDNKGTAYIDTMQESENGLGALPQTESASSAGGGRATAIGVKASADVNEISSTEAELIFETATYATHKAYRVLVHTPSRALCTATVDFVCSIKPSDVFDSNTVAFLPKSDSSGDSNTGTLTISSGITNLFTSTIDALPKELFYVTAPHGETLTINVSLSSDSYQGPGKYVNVTYGDKDSQEFRLYIMPKPLGLTIPVDPNSDIAAANELAQPGDTIEFAAGTYNITSQIIVKDDVAYKGAGPGLTIIDGNDTTRAFAAWGDRSYNEGNENPNDSGPKDWVIEGMTIQNCVADTNNRYSFTGSAFDMNDVFAENDADGSGGLDPNEANADSGGIRLPGPDGTEGTEDDDLHRFEHMDTDGNGELSQEELLAQMAISEDEFSDQSGDGGAVFIGNQAVGTIQNCDFLGNHTPAEGDGDDGGAIFIGGEAIVTITDCGLEGNYTGDDGGAITLGGLSVVTVNDCRFVDNYAASADGVKLDDLDGDGGHIKLQGDSASAITPGTTLIANRCDFLNGKSEDDGGAIMSGAVGTIIRLDACWFEGNTAADDGTVLFIGNVSSSELTVTNCVFANNISAGASDKMCHVKRNSKFINCTFVGNNQDDLALIQNTANIIGTDGDGVDDETADVTQVVNCIFANNVVGNGDDVLKSRNNDFTIAATNCLFFGNTLQNGNDADNTQRPAEEVGSILADPLLDVLFVPGVGSPAIDAGIDPATVGVTITTDLSGNPRPQSAAYDIGAYEVEAAPPAE